LRLVPSLGAILQLQMHAQAPFQITAIPPFEADCHEGLSFRRRSRDILGETVARNKAAAQQPNCPAPCSGTPHEPPPSAHHHRPAHA
jgi:hypothetical protein